MSNSPLLTKIGSAYNWYRNEMTKVALQADRVVSSAPDLNAAVHGVDESDFFSTKVAAKWKERPLTHKGAIAALATAPIVLMMSSNLRDEEEAGKQLSFLEDLLAKHPYLASMGTVVGMRELMKTNVGQSALGSILSTGKASLKGVAKKMAKLK